MVKIYELPINVVNDNKPKMLTGLAKMASGQVRGLYVPPSQHDAPPADRQDLNDSLLGENVERGKPVSSPPDRSAHPPFRPGKEAVRPNERRRVSEEGKSERRSVIGRIGACAHRNSFRPRNMAPQRQRARETHSLERLSGQTSGRYFSTRELA